jgi:hypothetical protein
VSMCEACFHLRRKNCMVNTSNRLHRAQCVRRLAS